MNTMDLNYGLKPIVGLMGINYGLFQGPRKLFSTPMGVFRTFGSGVLQVPWQ